MMRKPATNSNVFKKASALFVAITFVVSSVFVADSTGNLLPDKVEADAFFSATEWNNAYRNVPSWVDRSLWGGSGIVPQWVNTSRWRARVTNIHTCSQRNFLRVDSERGFSVTQNNVDNAELMRQWMNGTLRSNSADNRVIAWFTDSNYTADASHSVRITDGLGVPIRGKTFPTRTSGTQTTPFGTLVNQISSSNTWNGRPTQLRAAADTAIAATRNWTSNFYLNNTDRQNIAEGGVLNVNQTTTRASVASSRNLTEHIERRDYECGFDYERRNTSGNVTSSGTYWFLNATQRREIADPFHPRQVNEHNVAQGRHNAIINNFAFTDYGHGSSFGVQWSNQVMRYGIQEAYQSAYCGYENSYNRVRVNSDFRQALQNAGMYTFPAGYELNARQRIPIWEVNSVSCNIASTGQGRRVSSPHISHQQPFNELGSILWSYRFWDRDTGRYHATHQNREGLGPTVGIDGSRIGGNMIWVNNAQPRIEGAFNPRETRFQEAIYGQIDGIADSRTSALPSQSYQLINAVCNVDGMNTVLDDASGHSVQSERDYSKLAVSRMNPSTPHFGAGSGNASANPNFYTKECEFDADEVGSNNHTANNQGSSGGAENFGSAEEGNTIVKMRDNVSSILSLGVEQNPRVDSTQVSNTRPAYTMLSKSTNGSLGDMFNFNTADGQPLFKGNSTGALNLTNAAMPREYSSANMELIHGFVNNFRVSSPWTTESDRPEIVNASYAWHADLATPVPFFVSTGSTNVSPNNRTALNGTTIVPIIGRSYVEMGGSGSPSTITDVSRTSGTGTDVSQLGFDGSDRDSENSLVFEFIRSVSER